MSEDIRRAVASLFEPEQVVELRTFSNGKIFSGYYSDHEKLVQDAAKKDDAGHEVYVTLNQAKPALLGRAANRIRAVYKDPTTSDTDVDRRRWLLVDIDPERPAKVSSSDEEKAAAHRLAREVWSYLQKQGWPEAYVADSGNGYHLLYAVDLPNDKASLDLIKRVLEALDFLFSGEGKAGVDTSTHNAARMSKLYGTTARKGDSIEGRPHRMARLLSVPEVREIVSRELLEVVAAMRPAPPPRDRFGPKRNGYKEFNLAEWITEHGVPVRREGPWQRGGYRWVLEECPWNGHTDKSAYIVQFADGAIAAGCHHASCQDYGWRDLREHYEPGCYDRTRVTVGGKSVGEEYEASDALPPSPELGEEALYGLPGDVVRTFEPHTEADPAAVLANLLCAFGNAAGRGAFARVGTTEHHLKLFVALVGQTSKARKGESWGPVRVLMEVVDPGWTQERVMSGLSSGEGLIYHVRDEVRGEKKGEEIVLDPGEPDKRLLAMEGELAGLLKVMSRDGNTLSPTLRAAWDEDRLRTLTKNSPTKSSGAHISLVGHVTKDELLRHLSETEAANGFANRFLWIMVRRSKLLPHGGDVPRKELEMLAGGLGSALEFARQVRLIRWGESARPTWEEVYGPLSEGKPGLLGAVVARAEAQALRLATLYAVMDESETIEYDHLAAALALWGYSEDSARYIFGDATGDRVADDILEALRAAGGEGLTRTEIRDLFGRNKSAERINRALVEMLRLGRVCKVREQTGGRPVERWFVR